MKPKIYNSILACVINLTISFSAFTQAATYGGGTGIEEDPYQIWTAEQMNDIGVNPGDWGSHFKLMANIDMSIYTGTQYNIIGNFTGTFDGGGHVISNLTYTRGDTLSNVGLFRWISFTMIKCLNLIRRQLCRRIGRRQRRQHNYKLLLHRDC